MVSVPPAPWLKPRRQYGGASQSSCRSGGFLADTIYEELLARSAQESSRGAGQYFTPRPVIQTMCEVMQPTPDDRICGPAAGTGGFLCSAYQYVLDRHGNGLDRDELRALQTDLVEGMELSPKVGRMCAITPTCTASATTGWWCTPAMTADDLEAALAQFTRLAERLAR